MESKPGSFNPSNRTQYQHIHWLQKPDKGSKHTTHLTVATIWRLDPRPRQQPKVQMRPNHSQGPARPPMQELELGLEYGSVSWGCTANSAEETPKANSHTL